MTVIEERPDTAEGPAREPAGGSARWSARTVGVAGGVAFAAVVVTLWISWPLGVGLGLVLGVVITAIVGRTMHRSAQLQDLTAWGDLELEDDLAVDLRRLRMRLGDDWEGFARAAVLVTRGQQASLAGLQRELRLSTAAAQRVMQQLEHEGFVGPAHGGRRREVLVPRERADELEELVDA